MTRERIKDLPRLEHRGRSSSSGGHRRSPTWSSWQSSWGWGVAWRGRARWTSPRRSWSGRARIYHAGQWMTFANSPGSVWPRPVGSPLPSSSPAAPPNGPDPGFASRKAPSSYIQHLAGEKTGVLLVSHPERGWGDPDNHPSGLLEPTPADLQVTWWRRG